MNFQLNKLQAELHELQRKVNKPKESTRRERYERAKIQAAKRGKLWAITPTQYHHLVSQPCSYCELPIPKQGVGLDRIKNAGHYTIENVLPCCGKCNMVRNKILTSEEMKVLGPHLRAIYLARNS